MFFSVQKRKEATSYNELEDDGVSADLFTHNETLN